MKDRNRRRALLPSGYIALSLLFFVFLAAWGAALYNSQNTSDSVAQLESDNQVQQARLIKLESDNRAQEARLAQNEEDTQSLQLRVIKAEADIRALQEAQKQAEPTDQTQPSDTRLDNLCTHFKTGCTSRYTGGHKKATRRVIRPRYSVGHRHPWCPRGSTYKGTR